MVHKVVHKPKRIAASTESDRVPGRPRDPAADAAILRAATELFIDQGIEGANIEQIAKRAGVARATIYRRWRDKEELLAQAIFELGRKNPEYGIEALEHVSADELSKLLLEGFINTLASPQFRKLVFRIIGSIPSHPALLSIYLNTHVLPWRQAIARALERIREAGELPESTDVDVLLEMLNGAVINRMLLPENDVSFEETRQWAFRLLRQAGLIGSKS
jgi:AcrR family transcriptional regulator